ncbi:MAG: sulfatase, partial [PVC group bacterium]
MRKRVLFFILIIVLAAGTWFFLTKKSREPRPNLLLITMDTTRADRLGCYGYPGARTPALDDLAGSGITFHRFFSNVPLTLPSHATIMTGLYPPEHGCRVNGGCRLGDDIQTLAEVFSAHGYRTGAFVAAFVLDRKFGLDRGFDVYDDYDVPAADDIYDESAMYRYRRADRVADAVLKWLDEHSGEPFFCWVHFFDPHRPYYFSPAPGEGLSGAYDREIAFMDSQIGRLTGFLRDRGLRGRTVIIALGDHGEGLGDHGEEEHGLLLYNPVMRVPLLISDPFPGGPGKNIDALLSTVDLFPTILDIFGWEIPEGISGRSFAPGLTGGRLSDG